MYKSRNKENSHFINARAVKMLLSAMGKTELQAEKDLGWSTRSLKLCLSYKSKLSNERLDQLAAYLHQDNPSTLINYRPTKNAIKKYREEAIKKYREEQERKLKQRGKAQAQAKVVDSELTSRLLDQLVALTSAVNKLEQTQRDYSNVLYQMTKEDDSEISGKIDKLIEAEDKRQNYLVNELNKIKLNRHFGK